MIPAFILKILARLGLSSAPRWAWIALAAIILVAAVFMLARCSAVDDSEEAQAEQTIEAEQATARAAEAAIEVLEDRTVTDETIDKAVDKAAKEIEDAQDPAAVRHAVLRAVCLQDSHRNDPACLMLRANP
ncbi:hypothetical protein [Novosphingobium sp. MBES04]|uniref:hypothetical protein n=1 Tax=Novosphingobium sp. MBES04 TaxID=1206458 RepID=UPI000580119C|nr:hypothetical protein [Novosphingobium sp. MBES04]GAM06312.1 hypothetical protein MBENS4_3309 [Novosphingobium sp. MBES04]